MCVSLVRVCACACVHKCEQELRVLEVDCILASGEADGVLAELCRNGSAFAVVSNDGDIAGHGATRVSVYKWRVHLLSF